MTINDDTTRHDTGGWRAGPFGLARAREKRETEGNRRARTLPSRGRGKNCAAKARLVSRRFPADVRANDQLYRLAGTRVVARLKHLSLRSLAASLFRPPPRGTSTPSAVPRRETLFRPLSFHPPVRVAAPLPPLPSSTHPLSIAPHPSTSTSSIARVSCSAILVCICRLAIIFPLSFSLSLSLYLSLPPVFAA